MSKTPVMIVLLSLFCPAGAGAKVQAAAEPVLTGIEVLVAENFKPLVGKRVGLITNPSGVDHQFRSTVDILFNAKSFKLVALFGPEHGVRGNIHAGEEVADAKDNVTGLPMVSLYGKTRKPTPEMLQEIDVLVYDIQDIGCRSYTNISTLGLVMEAAAENKIPVIVLDRPDPLGGKRIEGRPIDPKFRSFVSQYEIPYLYGMTCGELARMINGEGWLKDGVKCDLSVIAMQGWKRGTTFPQTALPWIPTSPHIPRSDTAMFYAATGIMGELQTISEGVGYPLPFELAAAPFITDAEAFAKELNSRRLAGVYFRPIYFKPFYVDAIKGKDCAGVQIHITDPDKVNLTAIQFHVMNAVQKLYPEVNLFDPAKKRADMFDKVCGTDQIRLLFEQNKSVTEILKVWNAGRESFMKKRAKYLIYGD